MSRALGNRLARLERNRPVPHPQGRGIDITELGEPAMAIWQRHAGDIGTMNNDELITLMEALERFHNERK
jgi:hypothetical protein